MTDLSATQFFDEWAERYDKQVHRRDFRDRTNRFLEAGRRALFRCSSVPLCIDLGCGPGTITAGLADLGFRAIGVDSSPAMIRVARETQSAISQDCTFVCEDLVEFLEQCDLRGDLIISSSVFEYLRDPIRVMRLVADRLQPGGIFAVSIPNRRSVLRWFEAVLIMRLPKRMRHRTYWRNDVGENQLKRAAATLGLVAVNTGYYGSFEIGRHAFLSRSSHRRWIGTLVMLEFEKG